MKLVAKFEQKNIIDNDIDFVKVYLSITKETQAQRLEERKQPMQRWKISKVDKKAQEKWYLYTLAKSEILRRTDFKKSPWMVVDSNERFLSAIEIMKAIMRSNDEVSKTIENEMSIDLSPDFDIVRTANQEIARMQEL